MTITITKKPKPEPKPEPEAVEPDPQSIEAQAEQLVDELGQMDDDVKAARRLIKQYNEKRNKLIKLLEQFNVDPTEQFEITGHLYAAEVGEKGNQRRIADKQALRQALGDATFVQLANVNLTDIDKYLSPIEQDGIVVTERAGSRGVTFRKK